VTVLRGSEFGSNVGVQLDAAPPVLFLINVDWFFLSHFVFLAERLVAAGRRVIVLTEDTGRFADIRARGIEPMALPAKRGGVLAGGTLSTAREVRRLLEQHRGAVLHGFGVFGIVTGGMARIGLPGPTVYTVTGRGYMAAAETYQSQLMMQSIRQFSQRVADRGRPQWIIENEDDARALGLLTAQGEGRVHLVGGAGVDLAQHTLLPMPARPPLKLVSIARLIWSKGIDTAVAAVARAREQGVDVTLTIAGDPDPQNPRSLDQETLTRFATTPGVSLRGFERDVPGLLAAHHGAVLASRGGEGVPKGLIEAAASGRLIVTTDVPGCRAFAEAVGGWCVPRDDVEALVRALADMAALSDTALAARGDAARRAVEQRYTQAAVWQQLEPLYGARAFSESKPADHIARRGA
jgi:glycosyltransferase involved in cell wall biosynthesis